MESGHANHLRDDWSSTAYWYQTLPGPKLEILPVEQRLPRKPEFPPEDVAPPKPELMTTQQKSKVEQRQDRMTEFVKDRNEWLQRRAKDSQERSKANIKIAEDIRKGFLESLKK